MIAGNTFAFAGYDKGDLLNSRTCSSNNGTEINCLLLKNKVKVIQNTKFLQKHGI